MTKHSNELRAIRTAVKQLPKSLPEKRYFIFVGEGVYDVAKKAARDKEHGFVRRGRWFYFGGFRIVKIKPMHVNF